MDNGYKQDYDRQRFLQALREIIVACISWTVTGTTVILGITLYGQFVVLVALLLPFTYSMMPHIMNLIVMFLDRKRKKTGVEILKEGLDNIELIEVPVATKSSRADKKKIKKEIEIAEEPVTA